jgi:two-component system OmpR family response regulator
MTTRPVRILIVDEEEPLTNVLGIAFRLEGWEVSVAPDGASALTAVTEFQPDIVLLDMMLPDTVGTEVVASLRAEGNGTPVVFLTGRASTDDRIAAYAAGGDDYLTKPFGLEEVIDHLRPLVRRLGLAPTSRRYADLVLDESTSEVWRGDERLALTPMEFEMLRALLEAPESSQTLGELLRAVTVRGMRVPREVAQRMLDRMRSLVNGDRTPLILEDSAGNWMLAAA